MATQRLGDIGFLCAAVSLMTFFVAIGAKSLIVFGIGGIIHVAGLVILAVAANRPGPSNWLVIVGLIISMTVFVLLVLAFLVAWGLSSMEF